MYIYIYTCICHTSRSSLGMVFLEDKDEVSGANKNMRDSMYRIVFSPIISRDSYRGSPAIIRSS